MDARALVAAVDRLARSAERREPMTTILGHLCEGVHDVLDVDGVAVLLVRDRSVQLLTTCGVPETEVLERLQVEAQAGPSVEAIADGAVVAAQVDGDARSRWPTLASTAERLGV